MSDQNPEVPGEPDLEPAPEQAPEAVLGEAPEAAPEQAPEAAPEQAPEAAPEQAPEAVLEQAPEAPEAAPTSAVAQTPTELPPPVDAGVAPPPPPPPPAYAAPAAAMVPVFPNGKPMLDAAGNPVSDKSRLAAALLCWFVGVLGIHRFYVGKIGTGIAIICTLGGFFGIWPLVDLVLILLGSFRDKSGKALQNW